MKGGILAYADSSLTAPLLADGHPVYIDLSQTYYHDGPPVGMTRTEYEYARHLCQAGLATPVVWHREKRSFVILTRESVQDGSFREPLPAVEKKDSTALFEKNAILLMCALQWWKDERYLDDILELVCERELVFAPLIADVMWYQFSFWLPPYMARYMVERASRLIEHAAVILTISECSLKDIASFCADRNLRLPPVRICSVGGDIMAGPMSAPPSYKQLLANAGYVLTVASFFPHKNHQLLFNLWEQLLTDHDPAEVPVLACVASKAGLSRECLDMAFRNPVIRRHIKILSGVSDPELNWLYDHCRFTVMPSIYEGWGLIASESLCRGKVCVASNGGAIPEVAHDFLDLIHPRDFFGWHKRISEYIFQPEMLKQREKEIAAFEPVSWKQASLQMHGNLRDIRTPAPFPPLAFDAAVFNFSVFAGRRYLGAGWNLAGTAALARGESATLRFAVSEAGISLLKMIWKRGSQSPIEVRINGRPFQILYPPESGECEPILVIPVGAGNDGQIKIEFLPFQREKPSARLDLTIQRMTLERADDSFAHMESVLEQLQSLCPDILPALRGLLIQRHDLQDLLAGPHAALRLLFWAWRYGVGEEQALGRHWQAILKTLRTFHSCRPAHSAAGGYTGLLEAIWQIRPDLHNFSRETAEGQAALVRWLRKFGAEEYNLHEILTGENVGRD